MQQSLFVRESAPPFTEDKGIPIYSVKLVREFMGFARQNKMYWIIPLILFLGFTALMVVVASGSAPLIYTLF